MLRLEINVGYQNSVWYIFPYIVERDVFNNVKYRFLTNEKISIFCDEFANPICKKCNLPVTNTERIVIGYTIGNKSVTLTVTNKQKKNIIFTGDIYHHACISKNCHSCTESSGPSEESWFNLVYSFDSNTINSANSISSINSNRTINLLNTSENIVQCSKCFLNSLIFNVTNTPVTHLPDTSLERKRESCCA